MSVECVFCSIVSATRDAERVLEGKDWMAFMDSQPVNPGHVLIIPKAHVSHFIDLEPATFSAMNMAAQRIGKALQRTVKPLRIGLVIAGFDVPHTHLHVIPLHDYHDIGTRRIYENSWRRATPGELRESAASIISALQDSA